MPPLRFALYAASVGAALFAARSLLIEPPPLWLSMASAVLYVALILLGVFVLSARMFVDAIVVGPKGARGVALTFDDGPDPEWTPRVLQMLERQKAHATFFVIGKKAERYPELLREIVARGHTVGLHSYAHDRLFSLRSEKRVRADLLRGMRVLEDITGRKPSWFRPPVGHTNPILARVVDDLELTVVGWSASGYDGVSRDPKAIARRIRRGLKDGAIVLMHDAPERGDRAPAGVEALPDVLAAVAEMQLSVVPLSEFIPPEER